MSIPKGVQFKSVKPQGFFQEYRDYIVTPVQTYGSVFSVNDIVRMQFNLQDWYIDPYESYIEAEVGLQNETTFTPSASVPYDGTNMVQFLMMDGPSTSLINDFRLEVNSKEIERIREYDQLGNILTDLNMYPDAVDQKDYEGYYSIQGKKTIQDYKYAADRESQVQYASATGIMFTQQAHNIPSFSSKFVYDIDASNSEPSLATGVQVTQQTLSVNSTQLLNINSLQLLPKEQSTYDAYTGVPFRSNLMGYCNYVADSKIGGGTYAQIYNPTQLLGQLTVGNSNFGINNDEPQSTTGGYGNAGLLYCPDSPKLSQIDGHNIFLTNLPTSKIVSGQFMSNMYNTGLATAQTRAYMQIPLLSGVMGVLIPGERWQLIPTSSLGSVNMEFRFNPFAFFSYNDSTPNWKVNKFQLKLRLYRFDNALQAQIKQQIAGGIQMHSQIFSMGPLYNIQSSVSVTNNWQINNGIPSIKQLFFWFLSNDYETYTYARKNYKLSQNITSMQLKVGSTYIPQNPIIGHAGNIVINSSTYYDNSIYLSELHSAMNMLFDCKKHININKVNFAINERPYDVTMNIASGITLTNFPKKKRMILDSGYTLWNEMRCRGKALYAFNIDMDKKNDDTMTGIDTTKVRPIELILKSDDPAVYPRGSTMYVMFLSDFIVSFGANDTQTEGAG